MAQRLIDANELKDDMKFVDDAYTVLTHAIIDAQPTIDPVKQGWISVKDSPPEADRFLGVSRFNNQVRLYKKREWDKAWVVGGLKIDKDIMWWMPLPDGPKEEGEEEYDSKE